LSKNIRDIALNLCYQYIEGEIDKSKIQSFAESYIIDIDELTNDEILIDTIYDWEDEELNYPITKRNIELWKLRLETGKDELAEHNNWNVHIEPQKSISEKYNSAWSPEVLEFLQDNFEITWTTNAKVNFRIRWMMNLGKVIKVEDGYTLKNE